MLFKDSTSEIVFKTNTGWVVCFTINRTNFTIFISFYFFPICKFLGCGRLPAGHGTLHTGSLHALLRRERNEALCSRRATGSWTPRQLCIRLELISLIANNCAVEISIEGGIFISQTHASRIYIPFIFVLYPFISSDSIDKFRGGQKISTITEKRCYKWHNLWNIDCWFGEIKLLTKFVHHLFNAKVNHKLSLSPSSPQFWTDHSFPRCCGLFVRNFFTTWKE